jgi:hypothetical protein
MNEKMNKLFENLDIISNTLLNEGKINMPDKVENIESIFHDILEKNQTSLAFIMSDEFTEKISICLDLSLKADPLNMNGKMNKLLENLDIISNTLLDEGKISIPNKLKSISLDIIEINQNSKFTLENLTHFSTKLQKLSIMQKNHLENILSIADSISLLSNNFEYLITKSFFENWDNSFKNLINNNFQTVNNTL